MAPVKVRHSLRLETVLNAGKSSQVNYSWSRTAQGPGAPAGQQARNEDVQVFLPIVLVFPSMNSLRDVLHSGDCWRPKS